MFEGELVYRNLKQLENQRPYAEVMQGSQNIC